MVSPRVHLKFKPAASHTKYEYLHNVEPTKTTPVHYVRPLPGLYPSRVTLFVAQFVMITRTTDSTGTAIYLFTFSALFPVCQYFAPGLLFTQVYKSYFCMWLCELGGVEVNFPACNAGDQGSILRQGGIFFFYCMNKIIVLGTIVKRIKHFRRENALFTINLFI